MNYTYKCFYGNIFILSARQLCKCCEAGNWPGQNQGNRWQSPYMTDLNGCYGSVLGLSRLAFDFQLGSLLIQLET
jgi:hypothetical protein